MSSVRKFKQVENPCENLKVCNTLTSNTFYITMLQALTKLLASFCFKMYNIVFSIMYHKIPELGVI